MQQYFELRSRHIQKMKETQNPNPYPHKFHVSTAITSYIEKYGPEGKIKAGEKLDGVTESLAGRIHNIRLSGQNLRFYDLHGEGQKVQIMASKQLVHYIRTRSRRLTVTIPLVGTTRILTHSPKCTTFSSGETS